MELDRQRSSIITTAEDAAYYRQPGYGLAEYWAVKGVHKARHSWASHEDAGPVPEADPAFKRERLAWSIITADLRPSAISDGSPNNYSAEDRE